MAWGDLASNQMVSFTDAQGGGFSLNGGQSHVTSEQCMTKDEVIAKYNVLAANFSIYSGSQLVPKAAWASGVVYSSVVKTGTFTRTNCGTPYNGGSATYTVAAGNYTSGTSQAAADALAQADVDANGQDHVNGITIAGTGSAPAGSCTLRATAWRGQGSQTCQTETYYY